MKLTNAKILLNDLVVEQILLEQYKALYNCAPGQGYNPFKKKCYPIPSDISNLKPYLYSPSIEVAPVAKGSTEPAAKKKIDNPAITPDNFKEMMGKLPIDIGLGLANPVEAFNLCRDAAPWATWISAVYGGTSGLGGIAKRAMIIPKKLLTYAAQKAVSGVAGAAVTVGTLYFGAKGILGSAVLGGLLSALVALSKIQGFGIDSDDPDSLETKKDIEEGWEKINKGWEEMKKDPAKFAIEAVAPQYATVYCIIVSASAAFLAGKILRKSGDFIGNKSLIAKELASSAFILNTKNVVRQGFSSFFKGYGKIDDLNLLLVLRQKGQLEDVGIKLVPGINNSTLFQFNGSGVKKIPASILNEKEKKMFKKYISQGEIVLNIDKANTTLAKNSDQIAADIDKIFRSQAHNETKNIPEISGGYFQGNMQRLIKIMGRDGSISVDDVLTQYLKTSSEIIAEVITNSRSSIVELYNITNKMNKMNVSFLSDGQLRAARNAAIKDPEGSVSSVLSNQKYFNQLSDKNKQTLTDYLTLHRERTGLDLALSKELAVAKNVMDQEAAFARVLTGEDVPDLRQFLLGTNGRSSAGAIKKGLQDLRLYIGTLEEVGLRSATSKAARFFFFPTFFTGAYFVKQNVLPKYSGKIVVSKASTVVRDFADQVMTDEYFKSIVTTDGKLNLQKMFDDLKKHSDDVLTQAIPTSNQTYKFLVELCTQAPKNKDVISVFNESRSFPTLDNTKIKLISLVENQAKKATTLIKENKETGVLEMNKNDLKDIVKNFLNENYAKYPYDSEEYNSDEPDEDYMVEWKALIEEVCGPKKKQVDGDPKTYEDAAVEVAKLFVKSSDLFREVLETVGNDKAIGQEIMRQLKRAKDKKNNNIDKELNV